MFYQFRINNCIIVEYIIIVKITNILTKKIIIHVIVELENF